MSTIRIKPEIVLIGVILFWLCPDEITANGRSANKKMAYEVHVAAVEQAPDLNGIISENEWRNAALIFDFTQKEPNEGAPATEPTIVLISYDQNNIYFGVRCFDSSPQQIVSTEMRRDYDLSENDYFEIIIDTYHDRRNAFYFATNSLGARLDSEVKAEGTHVNWDWNGVWSSFAQKDELGWTVEIVIPFKTLRFDNRAELTWGINFARYIPRKRESSYWSPISRDDDFDGNGKYKPSKFGILRGLQNIKQESRLQLKPYTIGGIEREINRSGLSKQADAGLDAKVHITSNITADLTFNTDFAQVEADEEQVNLSRFDLFFPEKRDFFLEGLDIFNIGVGAATNPLARLFFSRRIGLDSGNNLRETPIVGGGKIIGKEGQYELGVLNVYTDNISYTEDSVASKVAGTNFAAFRIKRDILKRSAVGFMALSKDSRDGHYNRTFAIDADFSFDNNLNISGYLAKTQSPDLKGKDFNGYLEASWGADKYYAVGSFTDIGANFNPEMGFLQWQDIRKYNLFLSVSPRPQFFNIRQTFFQYDIEYITDHHNNLQYRTLSPGIYTVFNDESYVFLGVTNYYDNAPDFYIGQPDSPAKVEAGIYKYNVVGLSYGSDQSKDFSGSARIGSGSFYNGDFLGFVISSAWRPNDKFGIDISWEWNRVDLPVDKGKFGGNLVGAKFKYSFTTKLFLNAQLQWNELYNRFSSKILLNYIHTPGSNFYLVYSDLWHTQTALQTVSRTLLAKFTYLLDF